MKRSLKERLCKLPPEKQLRMNRILGMFILKTPNRYLQRGTLKSTGIPMATLRLARRLEREGAEKELAALEQAVGTKVVDFVCEAELSS